MNYQYSYTQGGGDSNTGIIIAVVVVLIILIAVGVGVAIWYSQRETSVGKPIAVGDLVEYNFQSTLSAFCASSTPSTLTVQGTVRVSNSNVVGVEWQRLFNPTPRTGFTTAQCSWSSDGKTSQWISSLFGSPTTNPTIDSGLKSIFTVSEAKSSLKKITALRDIPKVERFRSAGSMEDLVNSTLSSY